MLRLNVDNLYVDYIGMFMTLVHLCLPILGYQLVALNRQCPMILL